jgi:hypothetical protein
VEVVDDANKRILIEDIDFTSKNGLDINFTSPRSGYASVVSGTGAGGTDGDAVIKGAVSHSQASSSANWVIDHNLSWLWPNVTVYDNDNQVLIPQTVTSVDVNRITIDFDSPVQGYAGISSGGGTQGVSGSALLQGAYTHSQAAAASTWPVTHSLGAKYVNVEAINGSDESIIPQKIKFDDPNKLTITFSSPLTGYAAVTSGGGNVGPSGSRGAAGLGWFDGTTYISSSINTEVNVSGTLNVTASDSTIAATFDGNVSGSSTSTGSFGKLLGDGSSISGITTFAGTAGTETAFSGSSSSTGSFGSLVVSDKVQGDLTVGGTIYEQSAERFKTNIHPAGSQLEKVLKLNGVTFEKLNNYNRKEIGLIAEDVGEIYPEFVSPNSEAVNYGKMVAVLVEAIKELNEKIEKLEKGN